MCTRIKINISGVKLTTTRLKQKVDECKQGKRVQVDGFPEFETKAESEASDAESPLAKEINIKADKGLDKEEEEYVDVHFKRK